MAGYTDPGSMITGARFTTNINQNRIVRDVSETILLLDPNSSPLTILLNRLRKAKSKASKFEWQEDMFAQPYITYKSGEASSADNTFVCDTDEYNLVQKWDVLFNVRTNESMLVTATPTDTTITVVRAFGDNGVAISMVDGDKLYILPSAVEEGAGAPVSITTKKSLPYNYIQTTKTALEMTGRMMAISTYGGPDWTFERRKKGIEHLRKIEKALWFGVRKKDTTSLDEVVYSTRGAMNWLNSANIIDNASGAYTWLELCEDMETIARYNDSGMLTAFCSPHALTTISGWGLADLRTLPSDETYGINIKRITTPHITLNLIKSKLFQDMGSGDNSVWGKPTELMVLLDIEELKYRYIPGRDTRTEENLQDNDADKTKMQFTSDFGLEFAQPLKHGAINGVRYE